MHRLLPTRDSTDRPDRSAADSTVHSTVHSTVDLDQAYWVDDPGSQHVSAMMISSADGAGSVDGRSAGLGNDDDKRLFALLRAHADVLLVGASTVRVERYGGDRPDPEMRALRLRRGLSPAPRIAVLTSRADLDPTGPLFTDTEARPIILTTSAAPADRLDRLAQRADVIIAGRDRVDLAIALDALRDRGLVRVSCEGGPTLLAQLIAAGRLDELRLTIAPSMYPGDAPRITSSAVPTVATAGAVPAVPAMPGGADMELLHVLESESYLFLRYRIRRDGAA